MDEEAPRTAEEARAPVCTCPLRLRSRLADPEEEQVNRKYRENPWYRNRAQG